MAFEPNFGIYFDIIVTIQQRLIFYMTFGLSSSIDRENMYAFTTSGEMSWHLDQILEDTFILLYICNYD